MKPAGPGDQRDIYSTHPLLQSVQGADELLRCCPGGNQGGDEFYCTGCGLQSGRKNDIF